MLRITLLLVALCSIFTLHAQDKDSRLNNKVNIAREKGAEFPVYHLFADAGTETNDFSESSRLYTLQTSNVQNLFKKRPYSLSFTLQSADGKYYTLELVQSQPTADDARVSYMDEAGKHNTPYDIGLHYNGIIKGEKKSLAAMSMFSNSEVMILFSCEEGNFTMGKIEDNNGQYILYNAEDRLLNIPFNCTVPDTGEIYLKDRSASKKTGPIECKKIRIHWEADYTLYQTKGTVAAVQNYLTGIFNFMQTLYYNDGIAVELTSMYIWTIDDPYTTTNAYDAVFQFNRYWLTQEHTYYAEQAHLIADYAGWQGYAYVGAICFPNGYACSNLIGQQSATYPVYDLDVYIVAHETGHTVGSQHTQSCSWKTGPGGTCGSVDNCVTQESGAGCGTCFYLNDANSSSFKGTIMSYCGGKINFTEGFGPTVAPFLRSKMNEPCFKPVISPELNVQGICNNDGGIILTYRQNNFGVAPYSYVWSNSAQTKDINGIATPGSYSVTITDSNNCTITESATIGHISKAGDGIDLQGSMPYCCKDTTYDVTINATLPTNLTDCQTVAWLHTIQPITTYADLKTAYANANPTDLLPSTNDTSIDNSTAATLTVQSPAVCTATTTAYYTPYVAHKATTQSTYTTAATNSTDIKNVNINIGTGMTIPAEPTYPSSACEQSITNISDTITVIISNYTGRPNKLSIRIVGDDKTNLNSLWNLSGNGTYKIPVNTDNHFQQMTVKAFDFNCSTATNCIASTLSMQATRAVTYYARPALMLDSGCVAGKSVMLSFGPDSCNLDVMDITKQLNNVYLYPNPTDDNTTLSFYASEQGKCTLVLYDVTGKVLQTESINYKQGLFRKTINTNSFTAGVYNVRLTDENGGRHNLKLLVQ